MLHVLPFLICLGAATVGGVFFAFSSFVMKALAQLPASQGIAAMQRINVVVLNPLFLAFLSAQGFWRPLVRSPGSFRGVRRGPSGCSRLAVAT